jgi:Cu(I)/Ag(I) efflux system membrane fusion protein
MDNNKIIKYVFYAMILVVGMFIGWLLFGGNPKHDFATEHIQDEAQVWTCSMHPQIRQEKFGKCPICAMDLITVKISGTTDIDIDAIQLSEEAMALANVQTTFVSRSHPVKELHLYGTIKSNERLLGSQVSHVSGRIEKLVVNTVGENIRVGQIIATVYSPDLSNAQRELLEAKKLANVQPAFLHAAREKLRSWKLSDTLIAEIERTGEVAPIINITANVGGVVTAKRVEQGDYINQGSVLFDLVDLSSVWAIFEAYELDLPYLKIGDKVDYSLQSLPGKLFGGKIVFIDPVFDKSTRTVKIRVETANPRLELKPEMYASAVVKTSLKRSGDEIVIPKTAILWTGKRSIVYVKQPNTDISLFKLREIELGPSLGEEGYVVISGVEDGDEIVTNGAFAIDASAQLEGKLSMMNMEVAPSSNKQTILKEVRGLCGMCKERIETTAKSLNGVFSAKWDADSEELHLNFDSKKVSLDAIAKAIAKVGHDNEKYKAYDEVYNTLPGCCLYRE